MGSQSDSSSQSHPCAETGPQPSSPEALHFVGGRPLPRKALSVRQPWAWLIVNGHKDVENRDWPTNFRGEVLIHAGKAWGPDERETLDDLRAGHNPADWRELSPPIEHLPEKPELGGIVGVATIVGCVSASDSRWFVGDYGFMLRGARPLPFVECRGQLGFFDVGADVWRALSSDPQPIGVETRSGPQTGKLRDQSS